jgi:hypothetical protein
MFSSPRRPDRLWGPANLLRVPGALSPGVKRPGLKADHSPPASAEVKKMWIYSSTPPHAFMAQYLISTRTTLPYSLLIIYKGFHKVLVPRDGFLIRQNEIIEFYFL